MTAERRFAGQVALVTGAANGIGEACARRLAAEGAKLGLIDREPDIRTAFADLPQADVLLAVGDCTDLAILTRFVEPAEAKLGPPTVLVKNVGQSARERGSRFESSSEEVWRFMLEVSLLTAMRLTRLVVPGLTAAPIRADRQRVE